MLPAWMSVSLTILFLVGITNAVNLADGLDGLAGGTTFLCLCAVARAAVAGGGSVRGRRLCAWPSRGRCWDFCVSTPIPPRCSWADAGSQLLGFAIGVLSIRATQMRSEPGQLRHTRVAAGHPHPR